MLYQHPLAYLLGLQGAALLRAFAGEHGRDYVEARFVEIRQLLDEADRFGDGTEIPPISTVEGYRRWAPTYDEPGNGLIDVEEPIVHEILAGIAPGVALDAACGTGRHTRHLVDLGHCVIAVDASPDMLELARARAPEAELHVGDLHSLPVPDDHVDVVVCALALTHVPDLRAAMAELVRVLRPGGHLVISDAHGLATGIRPPVIMATPDGDVGYLPHANRRTGDYVRAALALGLDILRCDEPATDDRGGDLVQLPPEEILADGGPPNIWMLHHWFPEATKGAFADQPTARIFHLQRPA